MLGSSIGWILIVTGAVTAGGGLAAFLFPKPVLGLVFGVADPPSSTRFFARHWGVLIFAIGGLLAYAAPAPEIRLPVLIAGALEKFAVVALIFFGPLKRTAPMTAIAAMDGAFAIVYTIAVFASLGGT